MTALPQHLSPRPTLASRSIPPARAPSGTSSTTNYSLFEASAPPRQGRTWLRPPGRDSRTPVHCQRRAQHRPAHPSAPPRVRVGKGHRQIVDLNFGLVRNYAKRFTQNASHDDVQDFEGAGALGMMKAIDSYDPSRGPFASWAYKPILREVHRAVRDATLQHQPH